MGFGANILLVENGDLNARKAKSSTSLASVRSK